MSRPAAHTRSRRPLAVSTPRATPDPRRARELAVALDAVANHMQVVTGLTRELRDAARAEAPHLHELERVVDRIVQVLRGLQPSRAAAR